MSSERSNELMQLQAQAELELRRRRAERNSDLMLVDPDPVRWITRHFYVPELKGAMVLDNYQQQALRVALSTDPQTGLFNNSVIVWSDIKKSIKSTIAAAVALYRGFQVEWGQVMVIANDLKGADSRVGFYIRRAIELNPALRHVCKVRNYQITLPNHTIIESVPIDPTGEAGSNADVIVFSELWGAHQEAQRRMWTEATLSPMKFGRSFRWVETYAGFSGESTLLEQLYDTGRAGELVQFDNLTPPLEAWTNRTARMFMLWNTVPRLPWQSKDYYAQETAVLTDSEFRRVHRNEWASSTESFIPAEWWEGCKGNLPDLDPSQPCVVAMDAAVDDDSFGLVMVSGRGDNGQHLDVRYANAWKPPLNGKIDFQEVEAEIRRLLASYNVVEICYDPYQLEDMANRLKKERIAHLKEFKQGADRLVSDKALRDMIRDRRVHHDGGYPDLSTHVCNANYKTDADDAKLRIVKRSQSLKIDLCVCLSMATARANFWRL